jgi:pseudo-rSAM protein
MKPKFTGENIDFFIKYVFLDKEDLLKSKVTKKNIFAKQVLNTNDFGKLTINHTGEVFANTYHKSLGTINDDIRELVCKEMNMGISWRRIRNMNPCCDCVFQWICPSPSDYEIEIMKPNLCNIDLNEFC